ncbi:hypothetical protein GCM10023114_13330 [Mycolicibacterium sediminis]
MRALAVPPLFTYLWFTDPRGRVCRPRAYSIATDFVTLEVGTGRAPKGTGRMPPPGRPEGHRPG